jgi:hypothetical protein
VQLKIVMRGLDPRIHVNAGVCRARRKDVDGRNKSGHDDCWLVPIKTQQPIAVPRTALPIPEEGAGLDDFDWHGGAITRATPVTQNVGRFLHAECGAGFKFDRPFMQWITDGTPKTMGKVADKWRRHQGDAR